MYIPGNCLHVRNVFGNCAREGVSPWCRCGKVFTPCGACSFYFFLSVLFLCVYVRYETRKIYYIPTEAVRALFVVHVAIRVKVKVKFLLREYGYYNTSIAVTM